MTLLSGPGRVRSASPELTGEWDTWLKQIEQGALDRQAFMREIAQMTQVIVKRAKEYERDLVPGDYATLQTPLPQCGGVVKENYRRYACRLRPGRSASIGQAHLRAAVIEELLAKREIGPLQGFIGKMGRPFAAILRIGKRVQAGIRLRPERRGTTAGQVVLRPAPVGNCPKCQSAACSSTA